MSRFLKTAGLGIFILVLLTTFTLATAYAGPIKIGCVLSLTGTGAPECGPQQQGVVLAEKHINNGGGPLDNKLKVLYADGQSKPGAATAAVNKLVKMNNIPILLGGWSSGCSIAMSTVTIPNKVVQIGVGCTSPQITYLKDNDYFFRTSPSDAGQGVALAMLAKRKGYKTASSIVINNQYGIGIEQVFIEAWKKAGGKFLTAVRADKNKASYRSELGKVFKNNPDVVINAVYPIDNTVMMKQWYQMDLGGHWLAAEVGKAPTLPEKLGYNIYGTVEGVSTGAPDSKARELFDQAWKNEYDDADQSVFSASAYDATMIAALAIEKAGTAKDTAAIKEAIREVANPPGEVVTINEFA